MTEAEETFKWYSEEIEPEIDKLLAKIVEYNKQRKVLGKKRGIDINVYANGIGIDECLDSVETTVIPPKNE